MPVHEDCVTEINKKTIRLESSPLVGYWISYLSCNYNLKSVVESITYASNFTELNFLTLLTYLVENKYILQITKQLDPLLKVKESRTSEIRRHRACRIFYSQ